MTMIYVESLPPLMVSKAVFDQVVAAGIGVRNAFEAARKFAVRLLPSATAQFDVSEPLFVVHCDSMLVIRFDQASERFWIAAFYYDSGDPTPPDGPTSGVARRWYAQMLLASLGHGDGSRAHIAAGRDDAILPVDDVRAASAEVAVRRDVLDLLTRAFGREPECPPAPAERDLPKSRSNCFWPHSRASCFGSTAPPLDDRHKDMISARRRSGAPVSSHPAI